jgi:hypothetical protein
MFLFTTASRAALGPIQPPIHWVSGALSLGVKRPGCEAEHSPPSSAEVKNAWSYTSTPQYAFMAYRRRRFRDQSNPVRIRYTSPFVDVKNFTLGMLVSLPYFEHHVKLFVPFDFHHHHHHCYPITGSKMEIPPTGCSHMKHGCVPLP